jgi:hypothetical protein
MIFFVAGSDLQTKDPATGWFVTGKFKKVSGVLVFGLWTRA